MVMQQITLIYAENRRFWPFLAILWTSQLCNIIKPVILVLGKCRLVKNMGGMTRAIWAIILGDWANRPAKNPR